MDETNDNVRIRWREDSIRCFLEACIQEVTKRGRKGGSLQKDSWIQVQKQLLEVCNLKVTQKQMKNEYDYLKGKYAEWVYLKGKMGNLYNPKTNTFNLTKQEWEDFFKDHPKAKTLRSSPLIFPDLCTTLFEGTFVIGENQLTPFSNLPRSRVSSSSPNSPNIQLLEIQNAPCNSQEGGTQNPPIQCSQSDTDNRERPSATNSNFNGERPKKKGKTSMKLSQLEENMSTALKVFIKNHDGPSYDECVEKLNQLGWDTNSSSYVAALGIFCEAPSYRKGWMLLPIENVVLLKSWVASIGRKLGYL